LGTVRVAKGKAGDWLKVGICKEIGSLKGDTVHYKARLVAKGYAQ